MKKLLLLIFMAVGFSQMVLCEEPVVLPSQVPLTCSYSDDATYKKGIKRAPVKCPIAYLEGNNISFPAFASDCTFEVVDASTEEKVFCQYISASETSCQLPAGLSGEYIIRFVFGQYELEGYIAL
ncbi:hypothetical protein E5358_12585 [Palleniella muris]|uniref:Uncharacterized protein n=1 Tax=Palleniella muris TaxID=3038145 RepID=A0AC61QMT3_9BACT|nr:hypothetical protein [Palleniella muris]TGX80601.1 hypothetical protein E5358_12585 [Palleniella muris]